MQNITSAEGETMTSETAATTQHTPLLYHNVIQNRDVRFADDVADSIVRDGFVAGFERAVWLSDRPLGNGRGQFVGVAVHVPPGVVLDEYRVQSDAIENLGVRVYAAPQSVVNAWPRERWHPRDRSELVEE